LIEELENRLLLTTYYVSTAGVTGNAGTSIDAPMRTIQAAVDAAMAGDTILVRGGTYRETVTTPRSGTALARITIQNYENEVVTVNGTDVITGSWTSIGNEVYRAPMAWNYQFENHSTAYNSNQVFHNGQMIELARWPNQTSSDVVMPTLANADSVTIANGQVTFHEASFTDNPARWVGAKIWVNLARNDMDGQGQTGTVVAAANGSITVSGIDTRGGNQPWGVGTGTEFYLFQPTLAALNNTGGIMQGLDRGEWFLDTAAQQLYVRTPTGAAPAADSIEAKRRTYGFNLDGDSHLSVKGINLFGTSLTTDNLAANRNGSPGGVAAASNILIDSMNARYVSHLTDQTGNYQMQWQQKSGLILSGTAITFQNGDVRYSAGAGMSVIGRQHKVLNNVFKDLNLSASEAGMVNFGKTYDGGGPIISEDHEFGYNTLSHSPQQGINFRALKNSTNSPNDVRARIHHNVIHDVMLRSADSAAIDSFGVNHQYVRIDHNVIYNVTGGRRYGIYFDYSSGGIVDHNVVYNVTRPVNINWNTTGAQNMRIFNNVGISDLPQGAGLDTGSTSSEGSIIRNNIWSNGIWAGGWNGGVDTPLAGATVSHNLVASNSLFVDSTNANMALRNYQLKSTAGAAIDQGISVAPYDDDPLVGPPDIGAYEYGVAPWGAGAGQVTVPSSWIIGGVAYRDGNRNGTRDAGDPLLAGRSVYLDLNGNGLLDPATNRSFAYTGSAVAIRDNSVSTATITVPANSGTISSLRVTLNIAHTWDSDLRGFLVAPDGTTVALMAANGGNGDNFNNTVFDDAAATPIANGVAPFTGTFRPTGSLGTLDGKVAAGTWTLRIEDSASGDIGTINAFSIAYGTAAEPATTTAADGSYAFYNLGTGSYTVRQVVPSGWSTVTPSSGGYVVAMTAGTSVLDRDFGSYENSTPTVATAAAVAPNPPTAAAAAALSVLGADANGAGNLTYAWSVTARPTGASDPAFGASGTNAARSTSVTFAAAGSYTLRATITNAAGASVTSDVTVTVNAPTPPAPTVQSLSVNDGVAQRSMVTRITYVFSTAVTPAAGAFTLTRRGDGQSVSPVVTNPAGDGRTYVLSFGGTGIVGGSLADGVYDLAVVAAKITDVHGQALAGGGGSLAFHRLFGDQDGDRDVDTVDTARFKQASGSRVGDAAYRSHFDSDGDGDIDTVDTARFKQRIGIRYTY
jgi:subtilisin-like proprotein convertase family protein